MQLAGRAGRCSVEEKGEKTGSRSLATCGFGEVVSGARGQQGMGRGGREGGEGRSSFGFGEKQ